MIKKIINPVGRDLGEFEVKRVLPYSTQRMVGPFIFFDQMGPAEFNVGSGINVRPHPHINLATVTYLFNGNIHHRDTLGSDQVIEPGAINWMVAGKGIVHSERATPEFLKTGGLMDGIQLWVALPEEYEEIEASFTHYPKESFEAFKLDGVTLKVLLGSFMKHTSPVIVYSDMFYVEVDMPKGSKLTIPDDKRELAAYLHEGAIKVDGQKVDTYSMAVSDNSGDFVIEAIENSKVMLIGGEHLGTRYMFWNFISSSKERLEEAKKLWAEGPSDSNPRFKPIPEDNKEFIPLPNP
jgi:redox-sensitive bicupin YhaK (pirin superfamily)